MPLDKLQDDFLVGLGVVKRKKKLFESRTADQKTNDAILEQTKKYHSHEETVLAEIKKLAEVGGSATFVGDLETRVRAEQVRVRGVTLANAETEIKAARLALDVVRDEAQAVRKTAGSSGTLLTEIAAAETALSGLRDHARADCAADQLTEATQNLELARSKFKAGDAAGAKAALEIAVSQRRRGIVLADQFVPLFTAREKASGDIGALKTHAQAARIAAFVKDGDDAMAAFAIAAKDGRATDAANELGKMQLAAQEGQAAALTFNQFDTDLAAKKVEQGTLAGHAGRASIGVQLQAMTDELKLAKDEADKGNLQPARDALSRAETARVLGAKLAALAVRLEAVRTDLAALRKHAQRVHVDDHIQAIDTHVTDAAGAITAGDAPKATTEIGNAETGCTDGKDCATKFAAVMAVRASVGRAVGALRAVNEKEGERFATMAATATALADPPGRDYATATTDLKKVQNSVKAWAEKRYNAPIPPPPNAGAPVPVAEVDKLTADITALKLNDADKMGGSFADDVAAIRTALAARTALFAAGEIKQGIAAYWDVREQLTAAGKMVTRRAAYDTARAATQGRIQALDAHPSLQGQRAAMRALVARADGLATRERALFEDARAELAAIDADCTALLAVAAEAEAYAAERTLADDELKALTAAGDPAAIKAQVERIRALMADAANAAGSVLV